MNKFIKSLLVAGAMVMGVFVSAKEKRGLPTEQTKEKSEKAEVKTKDSGMNCFDFEDSCGGEWVVCHKGVSSAQLLAVLWDWDGDCEK